MVNRRPKIWILALTVLTAAALVFTFAGGSAIKATADKADFTQKTVYGDPSAAEGVSVTYTNILGANRQVKWSTDLTVNSGKVDLELSHEYFDNVVGQPGEPFKDRIEIYPDIEEAPEVEALAKETARSLELYGQTEITFKLSDHLEYIPVTAQYAVGQLSYAVRSGDPVLSSLNEMFRIKAPDNVTVTLNVKRVQDKWEDVACDYYISQYDSDIIDHRVLASGVYIDEAFYIYEYGSSTPYRYTPSVLEPLADGSNPYKVYRIPVVQTNRSGGDPMYALEVDKMTVIAEFGQSHKPIQVERTADGSKVMILGTAEDRFKAYVVDLAENGRAQTLDLCAAGPYKDALQMHYDVFFKDDYFVLNNMETGYYAVYPNGARYEVFHAPTDGKVEDSELARFRQQSWDQKPYDVSFENGRLVAAGFAGEKSEYVSVDGHAFPTIAGDSICLAVYTKDGLQYFTRYTSTLFDLQAPLICDYACSVEIH